MYISNISSIKNNYHNNNYDKKTTFKAVEYRLARDKYNANLDKIPEFIKYLEKILKSYKNIVLDVLHENRTMGNFEHQRLCQMVDNYKLTQMENIFLFHPQNSNAHREFWQIERLMDDPLIQVFVDCLKSDKIAKVQKVEEVPRIFKMSKSLDDLPFFNVTYNYRGKNGRVFFRNKNQTELVYKIVFNDGTVGKTHMIDIYPRSNKNFKKDLIDLRTQMLDLNV